MEIPEGIRVSGWGDVGGTQIKELPLSLQDVALRWRGVRIIRQIAFEPETLTAGDALAEKNAELR